MLLVVVMVPKSKVLVGFVCKTSVKLRHGMTGHGTMNTMRGIRIGINNGTATVLATINTIQRLSSLYGNERQQVIMTLASDVNRIVDPLLTLLSLASDQLHIVDP